MAEEFPPPVPPAPESMRLSAEENAAVTDHINRKALSPNDACLVCGSPANYVVPDIYRTNVLTKEPVIGGQYQPLISVVCYNCGFVRFFNKIIVDYLLETEKQVPLPLPLPLPELDVEHGS